MSKEAIIRARGGIGIIRFLSKYVSRDVPDQIYKRYVRPHLDYGDIIYHKYDPEFKLGEKVGIHPILSSACGGWGMGVELILTDFMKSSVGKSFTTEGSIDACVTFTNCGMIKDPYYLYSEIPRERNLHYNFRRPNVYEQNVMRTNRFSHTTYFQNCMRERNLLDETIKNFPTISVFKRELVRLVRPSKKSYFGIHDIE